MSKCSQPVTSDELQPAELCQITADGELAHRGVTVCYNTISDASFIIWDQEKKNIEKIQIIANLSVKTIARTTSLSYCTASLPSLCHSLSLAVPKSTPTVFTRHSCCEVGGGLGPGCPSAYQGGWGGFSKGVLIDFGLFRSKLCRPLKAFLAPGC